MTPPMTPREKVAVFDPCPGCGADEPRSRCLGCGHDFAPNNRQAALDGSTVTAPASGSGDHAELARLGERNLELSVLAYKWMEAHDALKSGQPYDYPSPADVPSILAENAALRAERDGWVRWADEKICEAQTEATEAERKLADARAVIERLASSEAFDIPCPIDGPLAAEVRARMDYARKFLTKEAERG